ncbi:MAG: hypothetical protein ACK5PS_13605 [Desulfopila sp.]
MERIKYCLLAILTLTLIGCGQKVVEQLNVPEDPGYNAPGVGKTVVILPFADYSKGDSIASASRRNMMITETLTDRLRANGFSLPVQEDVFQFLVAEDVIDLAPYGEGRTNSIQNALQDEWSETMKHELRRYAAMENVNNGDSPTATPGAHGLTLQTIHKIGRQFNADYIVRGRILEFKTRQDISWEPWRKGLLPFVNNGADRLLFGFASSDQYDEFNNMTTGGAIGSIIGHSANTPTHDRHDNFLGLSGGDTANTIIWGTAGLAIGKANYHSGRIDQAAVQMRVWIQEAATGRVVWTNRVSVKVSPESVLADNQYDVLFNRAIEKGITTLVDNFVIYTFM